MRLLDALGVIHDYEKSNLGLEKYEDIVKYWKPGDLIDAFDYDDELFDLIAQENIDVALDKLIDIYNHKIVAQRKLKKLLKREIEASKNKRKVLEDVCLRDVVKKDKHSSLESIVGFNPTKEKEVNEKVY